MGELWDFLTFFMNLTKVKTLNSSHPKFNKYFVKVRSKFSQKDKHNVC